MKEIISDSHRKAIDMMSDARKILFRELHYPDSRTPELVEGIDRLALAFEFVESPLDEVNLCPQCESFCLQVNQDGGFSCLCCDHRWI